MFSRGTPSSSSRALKSLNRRKLFPQRRRPVTIFTKPLPLDCTSLSRYRSLLIVMLEIIPFPHGDSQSSDSKKKCNVHFYGIGTQEMHTTLKRIFTQSPMSANVNHETTTRRQEPARTDIPRNVQQPTWPMGTVSNTIHRSTPPLKLHQRGPRHLPAALQLARPEKGNTGEAI